MESHNDDLLKSTLLQAVQHYVNDWKKKNSGNPPAIADVSRAFQKLTRETLEVSPQLKKTADAQAQDFLFMKAAWEQVTNPKNNLLPIRKETLPKILDIFLPAFAVCHKRMKMEFANKQLNDESVRQLFGDKATLAECQQEIMKAYIFGTMKQLVEFANQPIYRPPLARGEREPNPPTEQEINQSKMYNDVIKVLGFASTINVVFDKYDSFTRAGEGSAKLNKAGISELGVELSNATISHPKATNVMENLKYSKKEIEKAKVKVPQPGKQHSAPPRMQAVEAGSSTAKAISTISSVGEAKSAQEAARKEEIRAAQLDAIEKEKEFLVAKQKGLAGEMPKLDSSQPKISPRGGNK